MRLYVLILFFLCGAIPSWADVAPAVPDGVLKRIKASPDRFFEDAAILIHGFGSGGGIDAAGADRAIALERAGVRASAQRKLLAADMDGDGAVTSDELTVAAGVAGATARGRLIATHARADRDSDGTVSTAELTAHAGAEAMRLVSAADAAMTRAVLACDQNGDSRVTLPEVKRALASLDPAT